MRYNRVTMCFIDVLLGKRFWSDQHQLIDNFISATIRVSRILSWKWKYSWVYKNVAKICPEKATTKCKTTCFTWSHCKLVLNKRQNGKVKC